MTQIFKLRGRDDDLVSMHDWRMFNSDHKPSWLDPNTVENGHCTFEVTASSEHGWLSLALNECGKAHGQRRVIAKQTIITLDKEPAFDLYLYLKSKFDPNSDL